MTLAYLVKSNRMIRKLIRALGYEVIKSKRSPTFESHLQTLFNRNHFDLVIDVGANKGQFGLMLRQLGYRGEIMSFEPVSSTFNGLKDTAKLDPKWHVFNLALGESKEQKKINVFASSDFSSLLKPSTFGVKTFEQLGALTEELINIDSLDNFMLAYAAANYRRIMLKMDTQGFDLAVFRGAKNSLSAVHSVVSEISLAPIYDGMPDYHAALAEYESAGFCITGLYPVTRKENLAIIEMDCVMIKES